MHSWTNYIYKHMVKILVDYKTYRESKTSLKFWLKYVLSLWRRGQVTLNWADLWTRPQNPRSCISQRHDKDTRICLISLRKVHKRYVKYFWWCQSALKNNRYPLLPPQKKMKFQNLETWARLPLWWRPLLNAILWWGTWYNIHDIHYTAIQNPIYCSICSTLRPIFFHLFFLLFIPLILRNNVPS